MSSTGRTRSGGGVRPSSSSWSASNAAAPSASASAATVVSGGGGRGGGRGGEALWWWRAASEQMVERVERRRAQRLGVGRDRGQGRVEQAGDLEVVEADHRQLRGDRDAECARRGVDARREDVVVGEHRRR